MACKCSCNPHCGCECHSTSEASEDTKRLDWLEAFARDGSDGLLLHASRGPTGRTGLGLADRTLRAAIDAARRS